jgi:predicted ABC-type transport system involved in lysophospholipase L1 biosynthesis ATPase subunit
VSLSVRSGEILGLAGQLGSGRSELLECIFGSRAISSGTITIDGRPHQPSTPRAAIRAGLAFVPPDRKGQGLVLTGSIRSNLMSVAKCNEHRLGVPNTRAEDKVIAEVVTRMRVRMHDVEDPVSTLSGGNQQKVAIGRWLMCGPQVIMLDEPPEEVRRPAHSLAGSGLQPGGLGLGLDRGAAGLTFDVETLPLQPDGAMPTVGGQLSGRPDRDLSRRPRRRAGSQPLDDQDDPTGTGGAPGTDPHRRSAAAGEHFHRAVGIDPSQRADPVRRSPRRAEAAHDESPEAAGR